jgi:hypothetical protein
VKALLNAITARFPTGAVLFDAMPSWAVRSRGGSNVGGTGAVYRWALNDPRDIKQLEPKLEFVEKFTISGHVGYYRFQLVMRAIVRALDVFAVLWRYEQIPLQQLARGNQAGRRADRHHRWPTPDVGL